MDMNMRTALMRAFKAVRHDSAPNVLGANITFDFVNNTISYETVKAKKAITFIDKDTVSVDEELDDEVLTRESTSMMQVPGEGKVSTNDDV